MEKQIKCFNEDGRIVFSGYANTDLLEEENFGGNKLVHIWLKDRFIGVVICKKYELGGN